MDESPNSDIAVLEPVHDHARVPECRRTELLDVLRPVEMGDDREGGEEVPVDALATPRHPGAQQLCPHVGEARVQLVRHAPACVGSGHPSPS